jgi:hypothetical protein
MADTPHEAVRDAANWYANSRDYIINEIINLVSPYPLTYRIASCIYRVYGTKSVERLMKNPCALERDITNIGKGKQAEIVKAIEKKLNKTFDPNGEA